MSNQPKFKIYEQPARDPLRIVPTGEFSTSNILYTLFLVIGGLLIGYAIHLHLSIYDADFYSEVATVTNVDCNRFPVNNHRSEYHCVVGIEYPSFPGSKEMTMNSLMFVDAERFFEGDRLEILVDRNNVRNIKVQVVPDQHRAIICCLCGLLLMIVATGIRFIRLT